MTSEAEVERRFNRLRQLVESGVPPTKAYAEMGLHRLWFVRHLSDQQKSVIRQLRVKKPIIYRHIGCKVEEPLKRDFVMATRGKNQSDVLRELIENYVREQKTITTGT